MVRNNVTTLVIKAFISFLQQFPSCNRARVRVWQLYANAESCAKWRHGEEERKKYKKKNVYTDQDHVRERGGMTITFYSANKCRCFNGEKSDSSYSVLGPECLHVNVMLTFTIRSVLLIMGDKLRHNKRTSTASVDSQFMWYLGRPFE